MPDVYPYQPTTQGQQLIEARRAGCYRVQGPVSGPDGEGFCGWVAVLYYTRDMQGKQADAARRFRVNPGLLMLRAPGRIFYGGGQRSGQCVVERLDLDDGVAGHPASDCLGSRGPGVVELEHFLTQYAKGPAEYTIPEGARAVVVDPLRERDDAAPMQLSFSIDGTEVRRHFIRSGGCRILRGGETSIRIDAPPYPNQPELYWAFHWLIDL
jgi:hypothetical protein